MNEQLLLSKIINVIENKLGLKAQIRETYLSQDAQGNDALLEIEKNGRLLLFKIEVKNIDRFNIVENFKLRNSSNIPVIIALPYISRKIAEKCKSMNIQFIDTAGNAYIDAEGVYIYIQGQPRPPEARNFIRFKTRSFANIRVVFALLTRPNLMTSSYRNIMDASGVSLGSVQNVIGDLVHRGLISEKNVNGRKLISPRKMIDEWVSNYIEIRPKLVLQRFSSKDPQWWRHAIFQNELALWGGEVAAAKLLNNFNPGFMTIYVSGKPNDIIINNRLYGDDNGNIEILKMFWNPVKENTQNLAQTTHPLLIYADLLASMDSRSKEAARIIYDRYLEHFNY